jgi:hypothetical protein
MRSEQEGGGVRSHTQMMLQKVVDLWSGQLLLAGKLYRMCCHSCGSVFGCCGSSWAAATGNHT